MPRLSSEAISASLWREDDPIPQPPAYLKGDAKAIFLEVASAYPSERWGAAGLHLLEVFAIVSANLRRVMARVQVVDVHDPESRQLTSQMVKLSSIQLSAATKLRLCPSSRWRAADGRLDEKRPPQGRLLGGQAN